MSEAPFVKFPRKDLQDLVTELTDAVVIWDNEPMPFLGQLNGSPGYYIELSMIATATKGWDENRTQFDPVNNINGTTQISYRINTVQFRAVSYDKDTPAFDIMDQIRRGLRSLTAKDQYIESNIAFVDWGATRDMPKDADNRQYSSSVLDVKIAWQVAADPGDDSGNWIETLGKISNQLTP